MRAEEPFLVRHADLIFALKTFAASMLAPVLRARAPARRTALFNPADGSATATRSSSWINE